MRNAWLDLPLDDYEAHMALPYVGQAQLLSELLGEALTRYVPRSIALLGCAGGNGFERVITSPVERVIGIDINPAYIERAHARFGHRIAELRLFAGDLETDDFLFKPVELVFAGLLFEYVDVAKVLLQIHSMLQKRGVLMTVIQLPSAIADVTPSPYTTLGILSGALRLVSPSRLVGLAQDTGFHLEEEHLVRSAGGKDFFVQAFRMDAEQTARCERSKTPQRG